MVRKRIPINVELARSRIASSSWRSKVVVDPDTSCHLWTGSLGSNGYGQVRLKMRLVKAHRVSWVADHGVDVPEELELDLLCRVRSCVNPSHLEAVTRKTNLLRGEGIGAKCARKTHCVRGHLIPETRGTCSECTRERDVLVSRACRHLGLTHPQYARAYGKARATAEAILRDAGLL